MGQQHCFNVGNMIMRKYTGDREREKTKTILASSAPSVQIFPFSQIPPSLKPGNLFLSPKKLGLDLGSNILAHSVVSH